MFGKPKTPRKSRREKKREAEEAHRKKVRKGLLFWLPGGSSRLDVYVDYCVMRCLGKTKMEEKERVIPFTSIQKILYRPASGMRFASLQLITKEMPDVKPSYWYAYENNLVVVHPSTEEIAKKIIAYLKNPNGSGVVPPEYLNELKKMRREELRQEREKDSEKEISSKDSEPSPLGTETPPSPEAP